MPSLITGGNLHSTSFASLPPRFRKDFIIRDTELMAIFPVYENMKTICPSFVCCLPLLLASGVYHREFVKSVLKDHQDHCVFTTAFSRDNYAYRYPPEVLVGEFYCNETGMRAARISPLTTVLQAVSAIASRPTTGVEGAMIFW